MYSYDEFVPGKTEGKNLTPWLDHNKEITSISIGEGVTSVGSNAFDGCEAVKSVSLPTTLKAIGYHAFSKCSGLTSISLPAEMTSISAGAFRYCTKLSNISIPEKVEKIGDSAFEGCSNLTSVTLPPKLTKISDEMFNGCSSLGGIVIPSKVESIGAKAFYGCAALSSIDIPKSVTSLGNYCFAGSGLNYIVIPTSIKSIPSYAFSLCQNLSFAYLPYTVKTLGNCAFESCINLYEVHVDEAVYNEYGENAFKSCSKAKFLFLVYATLDEVYVHDGFQFKVKDASKDGSGTVLLVKYLGSSSDVIIPNWVQIHDCTYKVTKIYKQAFAKNTNLTTLTFGSVVSSIGDEAFLGCTNLTTVSGGAGITTIGSKAFCNCYALANFSLKSTKLKKIGTYAFYADKACKLLTINQTTKLTKANVKTSLKGSGVTKVKVKKTKVSAYKKIFTKKNCGKKVTVTK